MEGPQSHSSEQGKVQRLHEVCDWGMCSLVSHHYTAIPDHESGKAGRDQQHRPQVRQQAPLCLPGCCEYMHALLEQGAWTGLALCWFCSALQHRHLQHNKTRSQENQSTSEGV